MNEKEISDRDKLNMIKLLVSRISQSDRFFERCCHRLKKIEEIVGKVNWEEMQTIKESNPEFYQKWDEGLFG